MGTRSTVKFYQQSKVQDKVQRKCVLALYQQYDGYPEGVGAQIYELLKDIRMVNGIPGGEDAQLFKMANGIQDLALQYVLKYKDRVGNLYATTEDDWEEYNYGVIFDWDTNTLTITVDTYVPFSGTIEEFGKWIENYAND